MAFEATTPFAIACLTDKAKAQQSYKVLTMGGTIEARASALVSLAAGWSVAMTEAEAYQVVTEADRVVQAAGNTNALETS